MNYFLRFWCKNDKFIDFLKQKFKKKKKNCFLVRKIEKNGGKKKKRKKNMSKEVFFSCFCLFLLTKKLNV